MKRIAHVACPAAWWMAAIAVGLMGGPRASHAETIHLKDGRTVSAKIIERTDDAVRIDWYGVAVTYWLTDIERIEADADPAAAAPRMESASPPSLAPGLSEEDRALIDQLLNLGEQHQQLEQVKAQLFQMHTMFGASEPTDFSQRWAQAVAGLLEGEAFARVWLQPLREAFLARFNRDSALQVLAWKQSPAATKLAKEIPERLREALQADTVPPPANASPERDELVRNIVDASGAAAEAGEVSRLVLAALTDALALRPDPRSQLIVGQLRAFLSSQSQMASAVSAMEQRLVAVTTQMAQPLSNEELAQWLAFAESDAMRWYRECASAGMRRSIGLMMEALVPTWMSLLDEAQANKQETAPEAVQGP